MKTMKDYHNLHLKFDVLLLTDVFEKFRNRCLENYGLCLSHYLSAPTLSWDTMLSVNLFELDLISNIDMYLFFEKGLRSSVSYISKRYKKANSKYLRSYFLKNQRNILPTLTKIIYNVMLCLNLF